ncbi:MAG: hypothetical protein V3V99_11820 [candidate division Zixibacteria bacterium]
MKKIFKISWIIVAATVLMTGCGGDLTNPGSGDEDSYTVAAVLTKSLETDSAFIEISLLKNNQVFTEANVTLASIEISSNTVRYYRAYGPDTILVGNSYQLQISDSTTQILSTNITLPGSVTINGPDIRNYTGGAEAVAWSGSSGSSGYILATTPPAAFSDLDGYGEFTGNLSGSIPSETFMLNLTDRIVGTHMIYVAAYTGAPFDGDAIPFDIPATGRPANNITTGDVTGRVAGIVISSPDSIIVTN